MGNRGQSQKGPRTRGREGSELVGFWRGQGLGRRPAENLAQQQPRGPSALLERVWAGEGLAHSSRLALHRHLPVAVSGCSGGSGGGCSRGGRLCVSVGCVPTLQERRELTLQTPLPRGDRWTHTRPHADGRDTETDMDTDTHVGRVCFKLHQSACCSSLQN